MGARTFRAKLWFVRFVESLAKGQKRMQQNRNESDRATIAAAIGCGSDAYPGVKFSRNKAPAVNKRLSPIHTIITGCGPFTRNNWMYSTEPQPDTSRNAGRYGLARSYQQEAKELLEDGGLMGEGWTKPDGRLLQLLRLRFHNY